MVDLHEAIHVEVNYKIVFKYLTRTFNITYNFHGKSINSRV